MRLDSAPNPWFEAVERGDREAVIGMLDRGMEIDARGKINTTALISAIRKRQTDIVRILLDRGASLEPEDNYGFTAMTHAVILSRPREEAAEPDPEPLRMLLEAGGRFGLIEATLLGDVELARLRLDEGANPDAGEGRYHGPLLMIAARNGDSGLVGLLLDRGANLEATDDLGMTALIGAAGSGHIDIVRTLLDRGAKIDTRDWLRCTSLARAAAQGHRDVVELLLSRGAARGLIDAVAMEDRGLAERFLRESGDPALALHQLDWLALLAARRGAIGVICLLLDFGLPLSCANRDGRTLLSQAAKHGCRDMVRFLIGRGVDLHACGPDGMTPLAWAIRGDHREVAACLRDAGAAR